MLRKLALSLALVVGAAQADAANILITQFDHTGYTEMAANLSAAGHTVTIVDTRVDGNLAAALGTGSYDQVFLWDLTSTSYLDGADLTALASFWNGHRGLVVDSRSYGYHFQPNDTSEVALLQNVAHNLALSGGGVWVGTDHEPTWTNNGNAFLSAIGVSPVTGVYSDPVNYADPSSVLLAGVTPTSLWGGGQSVGRTPLGLQANGITMYLHFGHVATSGEILPYISASFPLEGPVDVPAPMPFALMGLGLLAMGLRRKYS